MTWSVVAPDGTKSVKDNTSILQGNTTYTKTTLNIDHYWNTASNLDGFHKKVEMTKQDDDITIGDSMDGGFYLKETIDGSSQGFYRSDNDDENQTYQFTPGFLKGTATISVDFQTLVAVPDETYGFIYVFTTDDSTSGQSGFFKASDGVCHAYAHAFQGPTGITTNVRFANGTDALALNIRFRNLGVNTDTFEYRVTFWDI